MRFMEETWKRMGLGEDEGNGSAHDLDYSTGNGVLKPPKVIEARIGWRVVWSWNR